MGKLLSLVAILGSTGFLQSDNTKNPSRPCQSQKRQLVLQNGVNSVVFSPYKKSIASGPCRIIRCTLVALLLGSLASPVAAQKQKAQLAEANRLNQTNATAKTNWRHPYYWAAFIPSGAWTTLDGREPK